VTHVESPHLVPFDGSFRLASASTKPEESDPERWKKKLEKRIKQFTKLQRLLYADDRHALLLVFQAMDAAGKDGTIRRVLSGVDPAGFQVFSFKQPSAEELDHDFLWRTAARLPERGRIGVFNRSYYEEVLVVRVHPEYLGAQKLPRELSLDELWEERYASIRDHEQHLWRNGTQVVKFFLHVSREEQRRRFVMRIDEPEKHWKFSPGDVDEAKHWDSYMNAYEHALAATSRPWAPWYAVPADDKNYLRTAVADILVKTIESMPLRFPQPSKSTRDKMLALRQELSNDKS
jgi:PPK2 family polyphosphate:nucleotide phosphotransferase